MLRRLYAAATPALLTLAVTAVWVGLSLRRPGLTYHFGPVLAAAAWPVTHRIRLGRLSLVHAASIAAAAFAVVLVGALVAWADDALRGPALVGGSAFAESVLGAAVGALYGLRVLRRRHGGILFADAG